jgi:hypothetical protein
VIDSENSSSSLRCVFARGVQCYRTHLALILALSSGAAGAGRTSVEHDLLPTGHPVSSCWLILVLNFSIKLRFMLSDKMEKA